jgi:hypothetical protein
MLTTDELSRMRATADDALDGVAVVRSGTLVADGSGDYDRELTPRGTHACRWRPIFTGSDEGATGGRISEDSEWLFTFPARIEISTDDEVEIVGGDTYNVTAVHARTWEVSRYVETKKVIS